MDYLSLLKAGTKAKSLAKEFVDVLLQQSTNENNNCCEIAANFINNCMHVIGLNEVCLTSYDLMTNLEAYRWPNECLIYKFEYNVLIFKRFEEFLANICIEIHHRLLIYNSRISPDGSELNPLEIFLEVIAYWDITCDDIRHFSYITTQNENSIGTTRFDEPLARLNLQLLIGFNTIRENVPILDCVCDKLFRKAILGIYYDQSHFYIFSELIAIFQLDFYKFYKNKQDTLDFFYAVLGVDNQPKTYIKLFTDMKITLQITFENESQSVLINYFIRPYMIEAYNNILQLDKDKKVINAVLEFLDLLQTKLTTVECFPQAFLEVILSLVFRFDRTKTGEKAAYLYKKLAVRLQSNDVIFKHILTIFASLENSPENLVYYVNTFWTVFPYIRLLTVYTELITEPVQSHPIRFVAAHMLVTVYKKHVLQIDRKGEEIEEFLQNLPNLLDSIKCEITYGIVLRTFSTTDFKWLKNNLPSANKLIEIFEVYAIEKFTTTTLLSYDALLNLFTQIVRCLSFTNHWSLLESAGDDVYKMYQDTVEKFEHSSQLPSMQIMEEYSIALQKVCIMLKSKFEVFVHVIDICKDLHHRLFHSQQITNISSILKLPLEMYAFDGLTDAVLSLAEHGLHQTQITNTVVTLSEYFLKFLYVLDKNEPVSLFAVKTVYVCLISLILAFPESSKMYVFKFDVRIYNLLIQTLILVLFEGKKIISSNDKDSFLYRTQHPVHYCENKHLMLCKFAEIHVNSQLKIPGNLVWKVCIYYGLPTHKLNEELSILLRALASHQPKIYKHIISVVIYNLYKRNPSLPDAHIQRAIKAHNTFINVYISATDCNLFKVHIILSVLDILKKSMQVLKPSPEQNRLEALKHMKLLMKDSQINCNSGIHEIEQQIAELRENLFTELERKYLNVFEGYCKAYCNCDPQE